MVYIHEKSGQRAADACDLTIQEIFCGWAITGGAYHVNGWMDRSCTPFMQSKSKHTVDNDLLLKIKK